MYIPSSIEGYPFIIRFKTKGLSGVCNAPFSIEGYPFIIRFKTKFPSYDAFKEYNKY